jgi:RyR domain
VPWEELPESLKTSNRRFAESAGELVSTLGGSLVPLRHLEAIDHSFTSGQMLERLAANEHVRWMEALRSDGWTFSAAPKNSDRKTHPLLVPWSELDESEREKDRDAIRGIPRMLAWAGFAIEMNATDRSPGTQAPQLP